MTFALYENKSKKNSPEIDILFRDLPKYAATDKITEGLILYMLREKCRPGDPFLSDHDVMRLTGRGRTSIRCSLKRLQDEGWIERRGGIGTFVGARVAELNGKTPSPVEIQNATNSLIRIGVMMGGLLKDEDLSTMERLSNDWFFGDIINGLHFKSFDHGYVVQLMNCVNADPKAVLRHFEKYPPDVLVCAGTPLSFLSVLIRAQSMGIPVVIVAVRFSQFDLHNIYEDNGIGASLAIDYLADRGHERIGFLQLLSQSGDWSTDRYLGYRKAVKRRGLDPGSELAQWVSLESPDNVNLIRDYLRKVKPTALLCGCSHVAYLLKDLVASEELSLPDDLSVITYDQQPDIADAWGGIKPTTIAVPLRAMGEQVGEIVKSFVKNPKGVQKNIVVPCTLIEGESVRRLK